MACEKIINMLSAFADDELNEWERQEVTKHLKNCSSCSNELQELVKLQKLLASIDDVPIPFGFDERLLIALQEEGRNIRNSKVIPINKNKFTNWKRISSVAAVFMVGLFSVILYNNNLDDFNQQDSYNFNKQMPSAISSQREVENEAAAQYGEIAIPEASVEKEAHIEGLQKSLESGKGNFQNPASKPNLASSEAKIADEDQMPQAATYSTDNHVQDDGTAANSEASQGEPLTDDESLEEDKLASRFRGVPVASEIPEEYLTQLNELLIDTYYEIDSYSADYETEMWTINVVITTTDGDGSEKKEDAVYCGQDGKLWKKEL